MAGDGLDFDFTGLELFFPVVSFHLFPLFLSSPFFHPQLFNARFAMLMPTPMQCPKSCMYFYFLHFHFLFFVPSVHHTRHHAMHRFVA